MATWVTPVTNRTSGSALMTYNDMNRITGNVAYLQQHIYGSATIPKTSWTQDDIIEKQFWEDMLTSIREMANAASVTIPTIGNQMHYDNINKIEWSCQEIYDNLSNVGISDFLIYGISIVNASDIAKVKDSDFLSSSTINKWNSITGG